MVKSSPLMFFGLMAAWAIVLVFVFKAAEAWLGITYTFGQFLFMVVILMVSRMVMAIIEDVSGY